MKVFELSSDKLPVGGIIRKVSDAEFNNTQGTSKVYFYVEDIDSTLDVRPPVLTGFSKSNLMLTSLQLIEKSGGKRVGKTESDGGNAFFHFFQDTEGNSHAICTTKN
jgi:predicted enzyme related to lactoylglutathione lyase